MRIILTLVLLLIVALCIWDGYKRGLVGGIIGIFIVLIALLVGNTVAGTYSTAAIPVLEPFIDGYIDSQKTRSLVLEQMGYDSTELSLEDVLESDSSLRLDYAMLCMEELGFHEMRAEELAEKAVRYSDRNESTMTEAVIAILCDTICYVGSFALCFLLVLILLMAVSNIGYLAFRLPDSMQLMDELGGALMGFVKAFLYCILLCWLLSFLGLAIGKDSLDESLLGRFFLLFRFLTQGLV